MAILPIKKSLIKPVRPENGIRIFTRTENPLNAKKLVSIFPEANTIGGANEKLVLEQKGDEISISFFTKGKKEPMATRGTNLKSEQDLEDVIAHYEGRQAGKISLEEGFVNLIKTSKDIFNQLLSVAKK